MYTKLALACLFFSFAFVFGGITFLHVARLYNNSKWALAKKRKKHAWATASFICAFIALMTAYVMQNSW